MSNKSVSVPILGRAYEVRMPTSGQFISILTQKAKLVSGNTSILKGAKSEIQVLTAQMVEAIATFNVLLPELAKDLKCNLLECDLATMIEVIIAYQEIYYPWYDQQFTSAIENEQKRKEQKTKEEIRQLTLFFLGAMYDVVKNEV